MDVLFKNVKIRRSRREFRYLILYKLYRNLGASNAFLNFEQNNVGLPRPVFDHIKNSSAS